MTRLAPNPVRFFDRILAIGGLRCLLWLAFAANMLSGALAVDPQRVSSHYDEHYFFARDDIARISVVDYHQLPAWNPYFCGGTPNAANPQDQALSPDFLLRILFGTGPGRRLAVLLFVMLGLEGAYRLARRHGTSELGAALTGIVFAASGRFFFMFQFGWINMFGFQLLPWAILGYERASRSLGSAMLGGGAIAWMLLNGGTYTVPFTVMTLVAIALWDTARSLLGPEPRPRLYEPWLALVKVGAIAGGLSAMKLLPMLEIIHDHPRTWNEPSVVGPINVLEGLIVNHGHGGSEYASESYVGMFVLVAALAPLFFRDRGAIKWLVLALLFSVLAMGNMGAENDVSLYGTLHHLPIYSQLRNPERYSIVVCLFLALAVGRALMLVEEAPLEVIVRLRARFWPKRPWAPGRVARGVWGALGSVLALGVALGLAFDLWRENRVRRDLFSQDEPLAYAAPFHQSRGNRWDAQVWPRASLGTLLCFEENPFPQSKALRGDLEAEERAEDPAQATVERRSWSPNVIDLHVVAASEATVLINQNWHKGWTADVGAVENRDGLLAVRVPAGTHELRLRFRSRALALGLIVSLLTALLLAALAGRTLRRRRADDNR